MIPKIGQVYQRKEPRPGKSHIVQIVAIEGKEVRYKVLSTFIKETYIKIGRSYLKTISEFNSEFRLNSRENYVAYQYKNRLVKP